MNSSWMLAATPDLFGDHFDTLICSIQYDEFSSIASITQLNGKKIVIDEYSTIPAGALEIAISN